jgi:hypothetical protein
MTATTTSITSAKPDRSRWLALYVLCASVLMIVIDATIVNVALPRMTSTSPRATSHGS